MHDGGTSSHAESLAETLAEHRQHLNSIQVNDEIIGLLDIFTVQDYYLVLKGHCMLDELSYIGTFSAFVLSLDTVKWLSQKPCLESFCHELWLYAGAH